MTCKIAEQVFSLVRLLQDEQKRPKDYGTGQLLYHAELQFLEAIHRHPGAKASELSECLGITKGAATQTAAKLAEKGLIQIYQQPGNKKEKFYRLTALGGEAREEHERFHQKANGDLCAYCCALSDEDATVILNFLQHLQGCVPFSEFSCRHADTPTEGETPQ